MELIPGLEMQMEGLAGRLETRATAPRDLPARIGKNGQNGSKPPPGAGDSQPKRTESLRKPGQKPKGGQPGQEG